MLLCHELVGDGPSRTLCRHSQTALLCYGVDFQHDAVCGHGQVLAFLVPVVYIVVDVLQGLGKLHLRTYLKAPSACQLHVVVMACSRYLVTQQIVEVGIESALCHHSRILALQCSACGISGIGEEGFFCCLALAVQFLEAVPRHQHLSPDLEVVGASRFGWEYQGDGTYGLDVFRHVVALHAIASRHGLC